jgi:hypothetical protein
VTKGNLAFQGSIDSTFKAFDADGLVGKYLPRFGDLEQAGIEELRQHIRTQPMIAREHGQYDKA